MPPGQVRRKASSSTARLEATCTRRREFPAGLPRSAQKDIKLNDDTFDVRTWTVPAPEGEADQNDWLETLSARRREELVAATQGVMQATIDWFQPVGPGWQLQFHVAGAQTCRFEGGAPGDLAIWRCKNRKLSLSCLLRRCCGSWQRLA